MKNISFFPFLVIIILLLSVNHSLYCQNQQEEKVNNLSLGVSFGFVYGQAAELVYPTDTKGELLSELLWDIKPVFYFQLQAEYVRKNPVKAAGLYTSLSFRAGLPGDSGILQDRDWMSIENDGLTHFSEHTNRTNNFFWLDATVGLLIPVKSYFYLKPFLSGSWMHLSFTGRDGYGAYARSKNTYGAYYPISDNPDYYSFDGSDVIRYKQDWLLAAAGISIGASLFKSLSFELSFQISPLTYCIAVDNHIGRKTDFNDYTAWGIFLEPKGSVSYSIGRFVYSLELAYRYIGRTKGSTYINNSLYPVLNESGAGLGLIDARLFAKFHI
ncbi:MAG: omptin family outer membrane protease [Treponema sp.]|nr:omptin family outer membrane protease [Treponema sp.]